MTQKQIQREIITQMERNAQELFQCAEIVHSKPNMFEKADARTFDIDDLNSWASVLYGNNYYKNDLHIRRYTINVENFTCSYKPESAFTVLAKTYSLARTRKSDRITFKKTA